MTSHSQKDLYLQLSQLRDPKKQEEEANEDQRVEEAKNSNMNDGKYGKIVKVQGGHIVRSTKKDKHSKILTSKGPKDRRFRLSAETAIQFYDVQDRLGCQRPSKAIDWLIENAQAAIAALGENSTNVQQPQQQQGGNIKPESKEHVVHDIASEAVNCAPILSEADFMEMAFFRSLMTSSYNAGANNGYNAGDSGEGSSFNSSYVTWK